MTHEDKLPEAALVDSSYRAVFEALSDAVFVHDAESAAIIDVNERMTEMFGYTREEAVKLTVADLSAEPFSGDDAHRLVQAAVHEPQVFEWCCRHRDSHTFWVEVSLRRTSIEGVDRVLALVRDIADRRAAEAALRESEGRFRQITEAINEVFWLISWPDPGLVYVSPSFEEIWGISRETLYREPNVWSTSIVEEDRPHVEEARKKRASGGYDVEYRIVSPGNRIRWIRDRGFPIRDEHGRVYRIAGVSEDITARKTAEAQLRSARDHEALLLRELDHRVRNNLAALMSLIDMSSEQAADVDDLSRAIRGRVQAMATAHELLSRSHKQQPALRDVLGALLPPDVSGRIESEGPEVHIPLEQVGAISMVLHEFMTNSMKYGALGDRNGIVTVSWTKDGPPADVVRLRWRETGGPGVSAPARRGVGTELVEGLLRSELRGHVRLDYPSDGVDHRLEMCLGPV